MRDPTAAVRLRRLCESITATRKPRVGPTGYIDDEHTPAAALTKGEDGHGRVFLTLCVRSEGIDSLRTYKAHGVVTVFQRYRDSQLVTQADNSTRPPNLIASEATREDMDFLERLVTDGEAERAIEGTVGGTLHERVWIIPPREACAHDD